MFRMLRATLAALLGSLIGSAVIVFVFSVFCAYDHERSTFAIVVFAMSLSVVIGFVYSRWFWVTESER